MSEAPERIVAWTHKYRHDRLWADEMLPEVAATVGATEYVRADRIEELTNCVAVLEAKLSESEALLAKAVEALDNVVVEYDLFRKYEYERGLSSLDDEIEDARTTLAEIKGTNQ